MLQINFQPRSVLPSPGQIPRVDRSRLWFGLLSFAGKKTHLGRCQVIISTAAHEGFAIALCSGGVSNGACVGDEGQLLIVRPSIYEAIFGGLFEN